jgi:hypothetical protein
MAILIPWSQDLELSIRAAPFILTCPILASLDTMRLSDQLSQAWLLLPGSVKVSLEIEEHP